ncbi:hypothetical protein AB0M92_23815 [Streptomyces sp. NPDC051582]|uniref:hypothetical protein n=1 Tax=Streptomyces sp. NPDC051582 TaxID=3155167 RepID=UPI003420F7AA
MGSRQEQGERVSVRAAVNTCRTPRPAAWAARRRRSACDGHSTTAPELHRTHALVRQFAAMHDNRDATPLPAWLDHLTNSGLPPLAGIATALREDRHAVAQGTTSHWQYGTNMRSEVHRV